MKDIRVKPARWAYICPGCHRRINIDTETIQMRTWSTALCNDEIACGDVLSTATGITTKAIIEAEPRIYCDECSNYYNQVDWDIADLVYLIQKVGINTVGSCSGHGGDLCYDGIDDIKQMMEDHGHHNMLVSAYVTYKIEGNAFTAMSNILSDFSKAHTDIVERDEIDPNIYMHHIRLDDGSECTIYFYNHETTRYGGSEKVRDEYGIVKDTIQYAEISFTYECNYITSVTERSAQKQMVELISKLCEFIRSNIGDYNY